MGILDGWTKRFRKPEEPEEPEKPRVENDDSGACKQGLRRFYIDGETKTPFCRKYSAQDREELKNYLKGRAIGGCLDLGRFSIIPVGEGDKRLFFYGCDL